MYLLGKFNIDAVCLCLSSMWSSGIIAMIYSVQLWVQNQLYHNNLRITWNNSSCQIWCVCVLSGEPQRDCIRVTLTMTHFSFLLPITFQGKKNDLGKSFGLNLCDLDPYDYQYWYLLHVVYICVKGNWMHRNLSFQTAIKYFQLPPSP